MLRAVRNIVILTHGWTGSSVFAALFGQAGCWLGEDTVQKPDYDTNENAGLVEMNRRLLAELAPELDHEHHFDAADPIEIARRAEKLDLAPYRAFVEQCSARGAWLWKDPRLTWTIRVWARVLDLDRTSFLILTRDTQQAWVSSNLRRHVQSLEFTRRYNDGITQSNAEFVVRSGSPALELSFEDLLLRPETTLRNINWAFGCALTMADLQTVCRQPLYRKSRGLRDHVVASLIYLKNYAERDARRRAAA